MIRFAGGRIVALLLLPLMFLIFSATSMQIAAASPTQYYLYLNETGIGGSTAFSNYYPSNSVVTINAILPSGSPFCINWLGSGPGNFTGTLNQNVSSINVTMNGPINETAGFVQCIVILQPLSISLRSSPPPVGSGGQVLLTGNWSGGVPPYNVSIDFGTSPLCSKDKNLASRANYTWYNSFSIVMSQNGPTYYCFNVSDSGTNVTSIPSLFVNSPVITTSSTSVSTTTQTTTTICSNAYCTNQYTVATTAFPTVSTSSATTTWYTSTTTIMFHAIATNTPSGGIIASIIAFFRHLFGLA